MVMGGLAGRFVAMLAGFTITAGLTSAVSVLLPKLVPAWAGRDGSPRRPLLVAYVGVSFVAASVGGYVAALIAADYPLATALALGIVTLVLGGVGTLQSGEKYPLWYLILLLIVTPIGVVAGGLIRMKALGAL